MGGWYFATDSVRFLHDRERQRPRGACKGCHAGD